MKQPDPKDLNPPEDLPWPFGVAAVKMIAETEQGPGGGIALKAYKCPAGVWTCGLGETDGVGPSTRWTVEFAWQRFCDSLSARADSVKAMCTAPTSENELAALTSLAYNIGLEALRKSTVLRLHNKGDKTGASRAFAQWNKARVSGKLTVLPGLVTRRAWEAGLYLSPDDDDERPIMSAQAVEAPPAMAASPTVNTSAVALGTGLLGAVTELGGDAQSITEPVRTIKAFAVDLIGIPSAAWPWALLVLVGAVVLYRRWMQRRDGVA